MSAYVYSGSAIYCHWEAAGGGWGMHECCCVKGPGARPEAGPYFTTRLQESHDKRHKLTGTPVISASTTIFTGPLLPTVLRRVPTLVSHVTIAWPEVNTS